MIFKLLGSMLIVTSSTFIGNSIAQKYIKRAKEIRIFQVGLQMLETEVAFSLNNLPDALNKIGASIPEDVGRVFKYTSDLLSKRTGISAQEAWSSSISNFDTHLNLDRDDKEILIAFGNSLGSSDKENQIKNIHLTCTKLSIQEKKAEELKLKNVKLYKNLGVLAGVLLVLILF